MDIVTIKTDAKIFYASQSTVEWSGDVFDPTSFSPRRTLTEVAADIGATPADLPGLWNLSGYPELTTYQLLQVIANG